MAVIGTFKASKEGGWIGVIQTLTVHAKLRFAPNDDRKNPSAPAFRVFTGRSRIGEAWEARSHTANPKDYLRVCLDDDPALAKPICAALFESDDGLTAELIWSRRRSEA